MKRVWIVAMSFALFLGCDSPMQVEEEQRMRRPPGEYRVWFSEVARCSGKGAEDTDARFAKVRWFTAARIRDPRIVDRPQNIWAIWRSPHDIVIRSDKVGDEEVVKHEILHELERVAGHESVWFDRCTEL